MTERGMRSNPARVALLICSVFLWSGVIVARLVQLQILQHDEHLQQALKNQLVTLSFPAPRGIIYDSHMDELAINVTVHGVAVEPRWIDDKPKAAREIASILGMDYQDLLSKMTDPARNLYMVVKHRIDPRDESRIEALGLHGVYLEEESMRLYPNRELACHVLGFVNTVGQAGAGIELKYDSDLQGTPGESSQDVDAGRSSFRARTEKPAQRGHSLVLSIDRSIQHIAERELKTGVQQSKAASGVAVVMESDTGRILALAGYPNFNGNAYNSYSPEYYKNRAVSDSFEPGSTFKVVVAAAALEAGLTRTDETIDCQMGSMTIGRHVFHDHKPYGILTFSEVLENSSNIGAAKLGLRLGKERLYEALRRFGFGSKTGIDLPGEAVGLVRTTDRWSDLSVPAISFGQEVGVTSVQILSAINAIANGGYLVQPSVVDRVIDQNGDLVRINQREPVRIMRTETAASVRNAFEGVVLHGTGQKAALQGYRAAGKTGTAQKIVDGRYSNTKYVASFIGFSPLPRPQITILVQLDEPRRSIYGGEVAAPIFRNIAQEVLLQLHVPPDKTLPLRIPIDPSVADTSAEDYIPNATPVSALPLTEDGEGLNPDGSFTMRLPDASIEIPDFTGMSKRMVINRCQDLGIRVQTSGSGAAVFQLPAPGTLVSRGEGCIVTFSSSKAKLPAGTAAPMGRPPAGNKY